MDNNNRRDFLKHSGMLLGSLMLSRSVLGMGAESTKFGGAEPILGEIVIFPYKFVPKNWAACNGQLLQIQENPALFALLGTMYGGDGQRTFALPDLRGRVPIGFGDDNENKKAYIIGQKEGAESHTLTANELPSHNHGSTNLDVKKRVGKEADQTSPKNAVPGTNENYSTRFSSSYDEEMELNFSPLSMAGGQAHQNMQPFLALQFCIALNGIFPSRP